MQLKDFMEKFNISVVQLAYHVNTSATAIYNILAGSIPRQGLAERIEAFSEKVVTVKELRGKDDRKNKMGNAKAGGRDSAHKSPKGVRSSQVRTIVLSKTRRETYSDLLRKHRAISTKQI